MAEKIYVGADHVGFNLKNRLVAELKKLGYEGWFAFETPHSSLDAFVTEATKNVAFVMKCMS